RHPYQFWSDAALGIRDNDYRLFFPMHVTESHDMHRLDSWPLMQAKLDLSDTANHADALGLFAVGSREPFLRRSIRSRAQVSLIGRKPRRCRARRSGPGAAKGQPQYEAH